MGRACPSGEGEFRVSGRWPFNSGCLHAEWLQVGVFVMNGHSPRLRDILFSTVREQEYARILLGLDPGAD
jgi:hypothetical protein